MIHAVFMGSPELAVPSLRALHAAPGVRVSGVFTQPDRPAGRKRQPRPCAVKAAALELGLPAVAPRRLKGEDALDLLRGFQAELIVVCAYGRILPRPMLDLPRLGCFNLHFSLLPRWRGASPLQAALLAGDATTGVSLQRMVEALDEGPIVAETPPLPIGPRETAADLGGRLAEESAALLTRTLPVLLSGQPPERPQDEKQATFCGLIHKADGALDWPAETAEVILRKLRAFTPWPGVYSYLGTQRLAFTALEPAAAPQDPTPPGVLRADGLLAAGQGWLRLAEVQPEGKRPMPWKAFLNGRPDAPGQRLTPTPAE